MNDAIAQIEVTSTHIGAERDSPGLERGKLVAEIHDREIIRRLIFEDAEFRSPVTRDVRVTIEMIRREAKPHCHKRSKVTDFLELKTADLDRDDIQRPALKRLC